MQKKYVLALLEHYPEGEIDPDELIRELYVKIKLEHAEAEIERGKTIPHDEVARQSNRWRQPS